MEYLKIIILSIIQGITEFLPISSSGHLELFKVIMDIKLDLLFNVVVHTGTLLAVVLFYKQEIYELICGLFKTSISSSLFRRTLKRKDIFKIWLLFIVAAIPAGLSGLFLNDYFESISLRMVGIFFIITSLMLFSTKFIKSKQILIADMSFKQALFIGIIQAFAVLPGISRSGSTITAAISAGVEKEDAGRFSFLLSIPLIFAAFLLKIIEVFTSDFEGNINILHLILGFIVSFVVGFFSLRFLINVIKKGAFWVFSIYMVIPAILSFVLVSF